ncbi:MAG: hypothetical protein K8R85_01480 [Bacteroidetes bacterium]|nr:hypothetical protein [Bacteroidota bacterium]
MALSQLLDLTEKFNVGSSVVLDVEGYDYAIVQIKTPSATIDFSTTNNGGNPDKAANAVDFVSFMGTNLTTQTGVVTLATSGIVRTERGGKYLKLSAAAATTVALLIVRLYKIA